MSLWPNDYDRLYDYRCPADLTKLLEDAALFQPCEVQAVCPEVLPSCSNSNYQRSAVFKGSAANALSAMNKAKMLNTILAAKVGAALGRSCEPKAIGAAELRRRAREERDAPFVPSLVMYRR